LREVDQKINLENVHYEELMLEIQLQKRQPQTSSASTTAAALAAASGPITSMASFEAGYMTDSSSIFGQPMITISQPNGTRRGKLEAIFVF